MMNKINSLKEYKEEYRKLLGQTFGKEGGTHCNYMGTKRSE
jgi:hypothetical protein